MAESAPRAEPREAEERSFLHGPIDVRSVVLTGIFLLLLFHTLEVAGSLLLPILLALLVNFALSPAVRALERLRIPAPLGAGLILAGVLVVGVVGIQALAEPARDWVDRAPESLRTLERKLRFVKEPLRQMSEATATVEEVATVEGGARREEAVVPRASLAELLLSGASQVVSTTAIVLVLVYFLLASSDAFLRKIVEILPGLSDKKLAVQIVRQTETDISRYLAITGLVNAGVGAATALVTWLFGLPNPLLWGALAALLNFIPYLGALATAAIVGGVALLSFDDPGRAFAVTAASWAITAFEGSFLTPALLGHRLQLSPVVVFVGLLVWSWLWGIAGTLVAVPILVVVKIACDHSERLRPLGVLLGR